MKKSTLVTLAAVVVLLAGSVGPSATRVRASNWGVLDLAHNCDGTVDSQCNTKSPIAYVYFAIISDPDGFILPQARAAMTEYTNAPELVMFETTSLSNDTVRFYTTDTNNGYWGWTYCPTDAQKKINGRRSWCTPQVLKLNNGPNYGFPGNFNSASEARTIACHELGHTYGLRHATAANGGEYWNSSCMVADQRTRQRPTDHDLGVLAALYPIPQ